MLLSPRVPRLPLVRPRGFEPRCPEGNRSQTGSVYQIPARAQDVG